MRSSEVATMTVTRDVRSNLAELVGKRRPATMSWIDRECVQRVEWSRLQKMSNLATTRAQLVGVDKEVGCNKNARG
jgi:uncharacterized protein YifN (PemK superfamily)